jgi:beta-xylosidase
MLDRDFADPCVLDVDGVYYAYATNAPDSHVQAARSHDLVGWAALPDALPVLPAWASPGFTWAPSVTRTPSGYVMYFAARNRRSGLQAIGVATSAGPADPFIPAEAPIVEQPALGGAIDPFPFEDEGRRYLLWKSDGNAVGVETWIHIQPLSTDGLRVEGRGTRLLRNSLPWEGNIVEAPTLIKRHGRYHLFYSANLYSTPEYAIGWADSNSPLGPYQKAPKPIAKSNVEHGWVLGPGGQDVLERDGRTWLAYHAWDPAFRYRALNLSELVWDDGRPTVVMR